MSLENAYELIDVQKYYQNRKIVDIEMQEFYSGELFAIVGPSGSGKSTLLRMLDFLENPTNGEICYFGQSVVGGDFVEKRRELGMLFQRPELLKGTVRDNIEYPLKIRRVDSVDAIERVYKQLSITELDRADAKKISGGELQRVALARVLVTNPKVLLLDEPTANLDPHHVELIESAIRDLRKSGVTVILVTHNVFQARRLADRIGLLLNGRFVEVSETEIFFNDPTDARARDFVDGRMIY